MRIILNGDEYEHKGAGTLAALLTEMRADPARVAIMLNDAVIPKAKRDSVALKDGDRVEVLGFAGGG
jgi:sulfur carrier protein